ncbi:uncharacterized protein [Nicotiana tomentosiformis]|uniref:uncharacterized protein n=1 Tax=Nicotiana tomentosiformis TaxID=4098 RepID=UPI00388C48E1
MIDDDGEASEEGASLHRRRRPSSTQQTAQSIELLTPIEDDASAIWGEFEMVEMANSRFRILVASPGTVGLSIGSLPFSIDEQPTTSVVFVAAVSHPSTPSASSPFSPTRPLATATSSPLAASVREEDVPIPQYPVHVELANYRKRLGKIHALSREWLLNNDMHNATSANLLASEGFQRLIREKEELNSEQNQLLAKQDQTTARLSELVQFEEAKAKWAKIHSVVLAASDREAASARRLINLEEALNSNIEELAAAGVKYAQLEEKYKKTTKHNRIFSSTVCELDVSFKSIRSTLENLSAEVNQVKEELKRRRASLVVEKTYVMYRMRKETLEEAKEDIINFDAEMAKACELESSSKRGLPTGPDASSSSSSGSETSGTKEELEDEDVKGQTDDVQDV